MKQYLPPKVEQVRGPGTGCRRHQRLFAGRPAMPYAFMLPCIPACRPAPAPAGKATPASRSNIFRHRARACQPCLMPSLGGLHQGWYDAKYLHLHKDGLYLLCQRHELHQLVENTYKQRVVIRAHNPIDALHIIHVRRGFSQCVIMYDNRWTTPLSIRDRHTRLNGVDACHTQHTRVSTEGGFQVKRALSTTMGSMRVTQHASVPHPVFSRNCENAKLQLSDPTTNSRCVG